MPALALAAALCGLAGTAVAVEADELHVRGFISQGWLNTRHNNYLVDDSRDGTSEFNEVALSLQLRPTDRLRVGAQLLARDFGETGNGVARLDWAYGQWTWRDWLHLRAGKIKTVMGLYGEGRDIDMLRPTVLLPQAVYPEGHRDFVVGVEGVGLHGNVPLSDAGGIDYDLWAGTLTVHETDVGFWGDIFAGTGIELAGLLTDELGAPVVYRGSSNQRVRFDYLTGGSAFWNSPLTGLRAGATFVTGSFETHARDEFALTIDDPDDPLGSRFFTVDNAFSADVDHLLFLSGEWSRGALTLAGEYSQERIGGIASEGYYLQATAQARESLALSAYAGRYVRDRRDPDGSHAVQAGYPQHLAWQNDYCLAARHDVNEHWLLKAEYHVVDGTGLLSLAKNRPDDPDAWRRWWSYVAVKATFHF